MKSTLRYVEVKKPFGLEVKSIEPARNASSAMRCQRVFSPPVCSFLLNLVGAKSFSMTQVDALGIGRVMEETCDLLCKDG